ncbi:xylulokinase [Saccharospirillum sp. MSK14-1]|uniref:xylulokinase n=1 Tax=Saccharospirillum sp. MSK14-1 TaxID=1897632 RepID=UPI000D34813D|nr:xylulokinase [Saccharospirillum sp. MSK14-1]PTY35873.1 xylulokinase [Saccharospirillum sp. MSK14-1]
MYLGIDLGTSGLKAILLNERGQLVAQATAPLTVSQPQPGWSEQAPEDWWQAMQSACAMLAKEQDLSAVRSVGLSGQMHGATLIDAAGDVIRPCMLWNDGRSGTQCDELEHRLPDFRERSGNLAMPGFTAPKVLWVAENEPDAFQRIDKVLLPKDYLRYRLTGEFASDMSDAAGTSWLNPAERRWDDQLLFVTGLTEANMPRLYEGPDVTGVVSAAASAATGLPQVPVVAGASDNAGGALGVGLIEPGQSMLSLGTSGVVFTVSDGHRAAPEQTVHAFCHALPGRWHQMSVNLCAAECLAWLSRITGRPVPELIAAVEDSGRTETSLTFLPYLSGERTPHNDPRARGQFLGLSVNTDAVDLTLAVLEGVTFAQVDGLHALHAAGVTPADMNLIGGGSRSAFWRQLLADALKIPTHARDGGDVGPALGAARLAQLADSKADWSEVFTQPQLMETCRPNAHRAAYLDAQLARFRALYKVSRPLLD